MVVTWTGTRQTEKGGRPGARNDPPEGVGITSCVLGQAAAAGVLATIFFRSSAQRSS